MSCDRCKAEPTLRAEWGCDKPTEVPFATFSMRGKLYHLTRCPVKEIQRTPRVGMALEAYRWLNAYGIPPSPGGFLEQSASFVAVTQVVEDERAQLDQQRRKK